MSTIETTKQLCNLSDDDFFQQCFLWMETKMDIKKHVCPNGCQNNQPLEYDTFLCIWYCEFCEYEGKNPEAK